MASNKGGTNKEIAALRQRQIREIDASIPLLDSQFDALKKKIAQHRLLTSVADGLYEEFDKLTKKAPVDRITDLAVTQINDVIKDTKQLCNSDPYVQRLTEFVPAGDNPEQRDALVVLGQLRQGLLRFGSQMHDEDGKIGGLLSDAKGIKVALAFFQKGETHVRQDSIKHNGEDVSSKWTYYSSGLWYFAFHILDKTDIPSHFS